MSESIETLQDNNRKDHSNVSKLINVSNHAASLNISSQTTKFQDISKVLCILEKSKKQKQLKNQQISLSDTPIPPRESILSTADKRTPVQHVPLNNPTNQYKLPQIQSKRDFQFIQASPLVFNTANKQSRRNISQNKNNKSALELNCETSTNKPTNITDLTKATQNILKKINDQDERMFQAQMNSANELITKIKRISHSFISHSFGQDSAGQLEQSHKNNEGIMENREIKEKGDWKATYGNNLDHSSCEEFSNLPNQSIRSQGINFYNNNFKSNNGSQLSQQPSQGIQDVLQQTSQYPPFYQFCFNTPTSNSNKNNCSISPNPLLDCNIVRKQQSQNQEKQQYFEELTIPGIDIKKEDKTTFDQTLQELLASNSKSQSVAQIKSRDQAPINHLQDQILQSPKDNHKIGEYKCNSRLRSITKQKWQDNYANTYYVSNNNNKNKSIINNKSKSFFINSNHNNSSQECLMYGCAYMNAMRASQTRIQELELLLQLQERKGKDLAAELSASMNVCAQTVEQLSLNKQIYNQTVGDLKGQLEVAKIQLTEHELTAQKQLLEISLFQDQSEYYQKEKQIWEKKEIVYLEEIGRLESEIEKLKSTISEQGYTFKMELDKILAMIQEQVCQKVSQNNQENNIIQIKMNNQLLQCQQQLNNKHITYCQDGENNQQIIDFNVDRIEEQTNQNISESFTQTIQPINFKNQRIGDQDQSLEGYNNYKDLSALKTQLSTKFLIAQHYENAQKNQSKQLKLTLISNSPERTSDYFEQQYLRRNSFPLIESLRFSKPSMYSISSSGYKKQFQTNRHMFSSRHIQQRNHQGPSISLWSQNRQDMNDDIHNNIRNTQLGQFFPSQTNELHLSELLLVPLDNLQKIQNSSKQQSMLDINEPMFLLTPKRKQQQKQQNQKQLDEQLNQQQISLVPAITLSKQSQNNMKYNKDDTNSEIKNNNSRIRQNQLQQAFLQLRKVPRLSVSRLSNTEQPFALHINQEQSKQQLLFFEQSCPSAEESNLLNFDYEEQLEKLSSKLSLQSNVQQQQQQYQQQQLEQDYSQLSPLTFSAQQIPITSIESVKSPNFGAYLFDNCKIISQSLQNLSPLNQANAITSEPSEDVQDNDFNRQMNGIQGYLQRDSKDEQFLPLSDLLNEDNPEVEITENQYSSERKEQAFQESFLGFIDQDQVKYKNNENENIREESSVLDFKKEIDAHNNSCSKDPQNIKTKINLINQDNLDHSQQNKELLILGKNIFEAEKEIGTLNKQYSSLMENSKLKENSHEKAEIRRQLLQISQQIKLTNEKLYNLHKNEKIILQNTTKLQHHLGIDTISGSQVL